MNIQQFNPAKSEIASTILEVENLSIQGVEDKAGYEMVKSGKKRLADMRIKITKFGKEQRDEAIKWQREVLRQEKELLSMIEPVENSLKEKMSLVDEEIAKQERTILIPIRRKLLEEINVELTDEEIVSYNEKDFASFFQEKKIFFLEEQDRNERERLKEEIQKQEIEERVKRAVEWRERELKEEQELKEKELERMKKNETYKKWLEKNNVTSHLLSTGDIKIEQNGHSFKMYSLIDTITI